MKSLIACCCAFAILCAGPLWAQDTETLPGAPDLATALAKYHSYLFAPAVREELDAINRDMREIQRETRRATTDEAREAARTKREAIAARLSAILESCPATRAIEVTGQQTTLPPMEPISLPGDSGAFLFKVRTGDGPARCVTLTYDLSQHSNFRLPVEVAPGCTTWALISLERVPQLKTEMEIEFAIAGQPTTLLPVRTITPDHGTLSVTVLSDDTGKPAPAMMQLVWKTDGHDVRPGNAINFGPQFDSQGNWDGPRKTNYPGKLAGRYWCVPGPFNTTLAPGEYEIVVTRGGEHVAVHDTVTVVSNETVERTYRPRRWVDMRKHGWYSGDDHVHAQILSDQDAENLMAWIQAEDVHLANIVKMGDIYRTWFEQRGFGKDYRVVDKDYVLSPGQECPRTHNELGHTISMNIQNMIRNTEQYYLYDTVFDEVHRQGGLSGYCHTNSGIFYVHRDMSVNIPKDKVDFIEMLQFANMGTDLFYDFLNTGFKVTASAGSDVPWGGSVGEVRIYAYTGKKFTADRWFDAVKQGHTFVTNGIMIEFTVDDAMPGDEIVVTEDRPLRVHARAWGDAEREVPSKLDIIIHGASVKTAESADTNRDALEVDFEIPAGNGFWIAARAEGNDGSRAHTTPIYVVREGLRFWKYEGIRDLIAKRETSLAEIEKIVAEAVAGRNAMGQEDSTRTVQQLALQGPELLKRVEEAKAIYTELRATADREAALRK
ncbi:MAG: CehA/McbA family metallohydrolase [Candidatus Hydrogenedentes bacterium]|nr:CehA/McbA family metallohydrolase [Candidatus Hydrogenedentota bacterium]